MRRAPAPPLRPSASIVEAGLMPRDLAKANQKLISPTMRTSSQSPAAQASFQTLAVPVVSGFESHREPAELARSANFERTASLVPAKRQAEAVRFECTEQLGQP